MNWTELNISLGEQTLKYYHQISFSLVVKTLQKKMNLATNFGNHFKLVAKPAMKCWKVVAKLVLLVAIIDEQRMYNFSLSI